MFVVREIMHCKPGKVRDLVAKFQAVSSVMTRMGLPAFRLMTDVSGEQFWTVVGEIEVESLDGMDAMFERTMADADARKAMEGYHDLVIDGRREIYRIES